jgi:hypothetical protein
LRFRARGQTIIPIRTYRLTAGALIATLAFWGLIRLVFPALDYYPPERLVARLERSWFVTAGIRKTTMATYAACALVLMTVFFAGIQDRWPGRAIMKGFVFASFLSVIWAIAFLMGWAFLGMGLQAAILNGVIDWIGLAAGGLAIGAVMGTDTKGTTATISWPAVFLTGLVFLLVYSSGAALLAGVFPASTDLLRLPSQPVHFLLLFALGTWSGLMFDRRCERVRGCNGLRARFSPSPRLRFSSSQGFPLTAIWRSEWNLAGRFESTACQTDSGIAHPSAAVQHTPICRIRYSEKYVPK